MGIEVFNRHESKFLINSDIYEEFETRLLEYMEIDEYNKNHEFYTISNLYFDTRENDLIRNSLSKPKYKEKLRLRSYGVPDVDAKVYLEIKKKVCGVVNKRRTKLKLQEAYDLVSSGIKPDIKQYMNAQVLKEIEYILKIYDLEPKLYLAYDRKAFFSKVNRDLRITFDSNIRTRRYDLKLESGDHGENLLDKGKWIMEIKAENNMPVWLSNLLSQYKIYKTSYSKYGKEYEKLLLNNRQLLSTDKKIVGGMNTCLTQYSHQPQLLQQSL
ncbi:polyphosphate polymerase domain-containing protein [Clostridium lacusfryxellense]|uniref:polyphosphate polymerase domain-containing protein n=1 Tax=Clostridium lacusfryxellense TaxID=205328 RepID=UPI001C0DDF2F|nr:polyphosphate polymerase domain-containing protein [Clostridium lacusfryxellense]MBU3114068.1 polyphosphate polymerase domain-containing protein [Clostridium lacusfryxellense]